MITLKGQNEGFSSVYKILTNQKIYKIYNQLSFASYHRRKLSDFRKIYDQTYKLNLSPRHKVISKNIIEIDELNSDHQLTIKKLFNDEKLLKVFLAQTRKINSIDKRIVKESLLNEIYSYIYHNPKYYKINQKIHQLKKYLKTYPQDFVCHGDLHLKNIYLKKNKIFFLDWDYCVLSSRGYDLAMFAYLEKLNEKQVHKLSIYSKISVKEIFHYLPICHLLDYLYLTIVSGRNDKKLKKLELEVDKFISNIL